MDAVASEITNQSTPRRNFFWIAAAILCVLSLLGGIWLGAVAFVSSDKDTPLAVPIEVLNGEDTLGGSVEYLESEEVYILAIGGLAPAAEGSVYQVWFEKDGIIVSAGLWSSNSNRMAFAAYSGRYDTMFLTLEPNTRGSDQPTTDKLITVDLTEIDDEIQD